ncbi:TPA: hypothetical protein HA259_06765, partial [Thermoplasmata archaeon]|nr:hypothetical protein [Thermoplasmata archaeon]
FLDEPTSGMDPKGREEMLELVEMIGSSDKTVLVSSHILQEVERLCDYIVIINNGKLVREGETKVLVAGEEGVQSMTVRGDEASLTSYVQALRGRCEVLEAKAEGGTQVSLLIRGCSDSGQLFKLAGELRVQIRRYQPERLDLEEVFLRSFRGGGKGGD